MIQRKQTIYLLITVGLLVSMLFTSLVETSLTQNVPNTTQPDGSITKVTVLAATNIKMDIWGLYYDGNKEVSFIYYTVLLFLTIFTVVVTIFMFKRRLAQIKLCYISGVFLLGLLIFSGIYFYRLYEVSTKVGDFTVASSYSVTILFPLLSLILVWLAYKGIIKDESLVRSLNRIR